MTLNAYAIPRQRLARLVGPLVAVLAMGCSEGHDADGLAPDGRDGDGDAAMSTRADSGAVAGRSGAVAGRSGTPAAAGTGMEELPPNCETGVNMLPMALSCTGLYDDIEGKQVASGVESFAPALQLWSDGAEKQRWVYLPPGTQINAAEADNWQFPIGTKFWKEFKWKGQRVETRLFYKLGDKRWIKTSYHWNEGETEAVQHVGGDVKVGADTYYIPSAKECDQCHKGRTDRALGFEPLLLGLDGATGLNLAKLTSDKLLTGSTTPMRPQIGDDGTGQGAAALGWLHVNCGVSCHNGNSAAEGYSSDLRLQLDPAIADGRSTAAAAARMTAIGVNATTPRWSGRKRIVPGSPQDSLLHFLVSTRDPDVPKDRMPPIASRLVDSAGVVLMEDWIRSMPRTTRP
jgi:hypothetical protein